MEFIERPNLKAIKYLNTIPFNQFKKERYANADKKGEKHPTIEEINKQYNNLKHFCKANIKTKGITKRIYSYSEKTPAGLGGRLFSGGSLQGIKKTYRGLLMRGIATDIDMKNCHPVLLKYICKKHNVQSPNLEYYINHRDECLSHFSNREKGKSMFLIATNNDVVLRGKNLPKFLKDYDKEMKDIQSKLVSLPDYKFLQDTIPEEKETNYNGSAINRILCYYENIALQHAIHIINTKAIEIAILMLDGLMVYGDYYNNPELLKDISDYVNEQIPDLNMEWAYKEHDNTLQIPDDFNEDANNEADEYRFVNDDNHASNLILKELEDILVYVNKRLFLKHNNLWIEDLEFINGYVLDYILKSNICRFNDDLKYVPYAQNVKSAKNVREALFVKIKTSGNLKYDDLYKKFHYTTKGRLCFLDGVLDFKRKKFYKWEDIDFEYYSTVQIKLSYENYFKQPNIKIIDDIKSKIFEPLFNKKTDLALQFFSRAFAGHCEDKNFATYLGNRDCGKGILFELFKAFGDYLKALSLDNILCNRISKFKEPKKSVELFWLLELEFCRLAFSQETPEPESGLKVNPSLFKKLVSGGDTQNARRNYDREDTSFQVAFTPFMAGNSSLDLTGDLKEHLIEFESVVQFKQQEEINRLRDNGVDELLLKKYQVKDAELKEKCGSLDWKLAIIHLIYINYTDTALSSGVYDNADENETTIIEQFTQHYEITNNYDDDIVLVKEVQSTAYGKQDWKKLKTELENLGVIVKKCKKGNAELRDKMCCFGIREKLV